MFDHERSLVTELANQPFALIGVNADHSLEEARKVVADKQLNWRSFYDEGSKIAKQYQIRGYPTLIVLDGEGVVHSVSHSASEMEATVRKLLKAAQ